MLKDKEKKKEKKESLQFICTAQKHSLDHSADEIMDKQFQKIMKKLL